MYVLLSLQKYHTTFEKDSMMVKKLNLKVPTMFHGDMDSWIHRCKHGYRYGYGFMDMARNV